MAPRTTLTTKRHTSGSAGSNHALTMRSTVPEKRSGSALLLKGGQDLNRFSIKSNNSVHPVLPTIQSLAPIYPTADIENTPTGNILREIVTQNYVVKVRVLHGIDLYIPTTKTTCQHAVRPEVNIIVNGSSMQSCTAAQHARNHSIWKKHELTFRTSDRNQDPVQSGIAEEVNVPSDVISMYVSLTCTACSCTSKIQDKKSKSVAIGEVGELQLPKKLNESYKISRFFPVIRRQQQGSQASYVLLPAGKIKLCIRVEVEKIVLDRLVVQPEIPKRPPFALPTNFGEVLQLKRKQLKATVVPEDNSHTSTSNQVNLDASAQLLKEITIETAHDQINSDDLKIEGRIGEGIHSCVSFGILRGSNSRQVAVKEFRHQHTVPPVNVLHAFQQEYQILARCRNQNGCHHVVELLGVTLEPRLIILMDYFSHGSLAQCLKDEAAWNRMSIKQKVRIGLKIGEGIAWLHKHNMIHRDIKSHNILIGDGPAMSSSTVKIGDLGSAVLWNQHEPLLVEEVGSSGYTAPEIFTHNGYDDKVDVWSFGIVLWELTSSSTQNRINPFVGMAGDEFVSKVQSGCRPNFIHTHQLCIKPIVEKCWAFDPSQRPNMDEVVSQLEKLCSEM